MGQRTSVIGLSAPLGSPILGAVLSALWVSACFNDLNYLKNRQCGPGLQLCGNRCQASCDDAATDDAAQGTGGSDGVGGHDAAVGEDATDESLLEAKDASDASQRSDGEARDVSDPKPDGAVDSSADGAGDSGRGDASADAYADADAFVRPDVDPPAVAWRAYLPLQQAATAGTTADSTGHGYDMTYAGSVSFSNNEMVFGSGSPVATIPPKDTVPVIALDGSYSISVWIKLKSDPTRDWTCLSIMSADGTLVSEFYLQTRYDNNSGAFSFTMSKTDTKTGANEDACKTNSSVVPLQSRLYHLAVTRDVTTGNNILYVDGVSSGTYTCRREDGYGWTTGAGSIELGHGMWGGNKVDYWEGSVSGLALVDRVLTPEEVQALYLWGPTFVPSAPTDQ